MTIDLDAIKARLAAPYAAGAYDITRLLVNAPADLTVLIREMERLRGEAERERAAVVAWLLRNHYDDTAERIERGEHRRGENE
jgi:hypothetical protein